MNFVVSYDITQDRRRTKVMNKLKNYGLRVQYSVFECELDAARLARLKEEVVPLLNLRTDKLHVYRLCETCWLRSETFGVERGG
jgi:CRISPR-associated protein Cas2